MIIYLRRKRQNRQLWFVRLLNTACGILFLSFPVLLNVCRGFQQLSGMGGGCISGSSIVVEHNSVFLLKNEF